MEKVIDINGKEHELSENEINRGILYDRLLAFAEKEENPDEKELLDSLAQWLDSVSFE